MWRVRLYSDRAGVDFVRILLFDDFAQSVDQAALTASATTLPPLTPDEQQQLDAARAAAAKPPPPPSVTAPTGAPTPATPPAQTSTPAQKDVRAVRVQTASDAPARPKPVVKPAKSKPVAKLPKSKPKIPKGAFQPDNLPPAKRGRPGGL